MKQLAMFLGTMLLACCLIAPVHAEDTKKWDAWDGALFTTYVGLNVIDTVQTMEAMEHGYKETNPILGSHPTYPKLIGLKTLMGSVVYYVADNLSSADRKFLLTVVDIMYIGVVYNNYSIGIRVGF